MRILILWIALVNGLLQSGTLWRVSSSALWQESPSSFPPYGSPSGTSLFPSYEERATLVWYNAARIDPVLFRDNWITSFMTQGDDSWRNVFATSLYPPQLPLKWNLDLARVARAHCTDRQTCDPTVGGTGTSDCPAEPLHNDCNSTSFCQRIQSYYTPLDKYGEVLWDYSDWRLDGSTQPGQIEQLWPFYAVAGWICDGPMFSTGLFSQCPTDDSSLAAHRSNMMTIPSGGVGEVGCGQVYDANLPRMLSTCDMSTNAPTLYSSLVIFSGSHLIQPDNTSQYSYWVNYHSPGASLVSAVVNVDGVNFPLSIQPGARANPGTYTSTRFSYEPTTERCHEYYFQLTLHDNYTEIYPYVGSFSTKGIGACSVDWTGLSVNASGAASDWSAFSSCSSKCGGGVQMRQCVPRGLPCVGPSQQSCNTWPCPALNAAVKVHTWSWLSCLVLLLPTSVRLLNKSSRC